ncbi:hypothetical protein HN511_04010 [bacterium]|jgi:hypothetical protein|nr:hypothetical protein [bacterium]
MKKHVFLLFVLLCGSSQFFAASTGGKEGAVDASPEAFVRMQKGYPGDTVAVLPLPVEPVAGTIFVEGVEQDICVEHYLVVGKLCKETGNVVWYSKAAPKSINVEVCSQFRNETSVKFVGDESADAVWTILHYPSWLDEPGSGFGD